MDAGRVGRGNRNRDGERSGTLGTEQIRVEMRIRHGLKPSKGDDFAVTSSERIVALWQSISHAIFTALILLVAISLVIGGVVIMNVMMVSVNERTREIGLRKAVGARGQDILVQFIAEALTISLLGGLLGLALGAAIAGLATLTGQVSAVISPGAVAMAVGFALAVGLFFGIYPAQRAARLNPIDALHYE